MPIWIYGKNPVLEAIKARRPIHEIVLDDQKRTSHFSSLEGVKITLVDRKVMDKRFSEGHQGFAALVADYGTKTLKESLNTQNKKLYVMLDGLSDPHNFGAVIRVAAGFNATGVIIPKDRSVGITPSVVKVSTGAIEYVDIIIVNNLAQSIETLKKAHVWVVGTELDTDKTLKDIHADTDLCVVLGSEGKGLHRLVKERCDYTVRIPISNKVDSLNVGVACGILLYDITRRR